MMNEMENREMEKKKKGLTFEEFKILWEEKKNREKEKWMYNIVVLKGRGNILYADDYRIINNKDVSLKLEGKVIGVLKLSIIKSIL